MKNPYIEEIKKLQAQVDSLRNELAKVIANQIPEDAFPVTFLYARVMCEHPEFIYPSALAALLYNNGCTVINNQWTYNGKNIGINTDRIPHFE